MGYSRTERRLRDGGIVILDGGTGTELQRRGVPMHPQAWAGPASLENAAVLEAIHRDYIAAGADVITANTFATSRLMLGPAGLGDLLEEINRTAIGAAHRARTASGSDDVLIAGSLSHMSPVVGDTEQYDMARAPSKAEMQDAFAELAVLLREEGCDLILVEMAYRPERIALALEAAQETGLPVWLGFSARRSEDGRMLGHALEKDIPFADIVQAVTSFQPAAAGIMHTASNAIGDALAILREVFTGPLMAYPDSGYFKMPEWQFQDIIPPNEFLRFAEQWVADGVQIVGGCCGLSPEHIAVLAPLKGGGYGRDKQRKSDPT